MSRVDATLRRVAVGVQIRDGGSIRGGWKRSANGTWIDGESRDEYVLPLGGMFRTGHTLWVLTRARPVGDSLLAGVSRSIDAARTEIDLATSQMVRRLSEGRAVGQSLLVTGPRGTGKQVVAREARRVLEKRLGRKVPFVTVPAPALTSGTAAADLYGVVNGYATGVKARDGYFVQADGGIVFFDEVGDAPLDEQAKLLNALAEREVTPLGARSPVSFDALVVAATNRDLTTGFREDLFDRLGRFVITLPPLDERKEDIPFLFNALLGRHAPDMAVGFQLVEATMKRSWPGNVRQLDAVIERMVAVADLDAATRLTLEHFERALDTVPEPSALPVSPRTTPRPKRHTTDPMTRTPTPRPSESRRRNPPYEELYAVLVEVGWNKTEAGRHFNTSARQIRRWMQYLDIKTPD